MPHQQGVRVAAMRAPVQATGLHQSGAHGRWGEPGRGGGGWVSGLGPVQESILKQRTDADKAMQQERAHTAAAGHRACHRANRLQKSDLQTQGSPLLSVAAFSSCETPPKSEKRQWPHRPGSSHQEALPA